MATATDVRMAFCVDLEDTMYIAVCGNKVLCVVPRRVSCPSFAERNFWIFGKFADAAANILVGMGSSTDESDTKKRKRY